MTEQLLHDLFHALLPTLTANVDYLFTGAVAVVLYWLRAKLQVRAVEDVVAEVEDEAQPNVAAGHGKASGELKKWRAMKRSSERMNIVMRPREKRLDKLIERAVKKQKSAK